MSRSNNIKLIQSDNFLNCFELFQIYNRSRNLSKTTIENYEYTKKSLLTFMDGDFSLDEFNQEKLTEFILCQQEKGNNAVTINTKIKNLSAMFSYFAKMDYCQPITFEKLKTEKTIKETYTISELEALLKKPSLKSKGLGFDDLRNWAIVNFFIGTACRLESLINIQMKDLDLDDDEVILRHVKNRKQQLLPISSELHRVLVEYLKYRKPKTDDDYLFCTWHGEKIGHYGLINAIARYNNRRGVQKTSVHLFRHTFARLWISNSGDVLRLQKILGHSSLKMVQHYVNLYGSDLKKNLDIYNPLDNLVIKKKEHIKIK